MGAIEVNELTVRHGTITAVDAISFDVQPGEIVALLGPNGAGKTTTLETIEGYRQPNGGSVRVFGLDPMTQRDQLAHRWGVMPQSGGLPMGLTVREAIDLFAALGGGARSSTDELLAATGLAALADRRWRRLSGGEQQRLSLAVALCGGSDLFLLDEPTSAVDQAGRQQVLDLIRQNSANGAGVLVTTHRFDDIERLADRIVILHQGSIAAQGTLDELTAGRDEITFVAEPGLPVKELADALGRTVTTLGDGRYRVEAAPTPETIAAVNAWLGARGLVASELRAGSRSLEEVFAELTDEPATKGAA